MTARHSAGNGPEGGRGAGRRIVRIVLAVGLLLTAVVAVTSYRVHRRTQYDPTFCSASCHHKRDDAGDWHTRGHEGIDCQRCHKYPERLGCARCCRYRKIPGTFQEYLAEIKEC